MICSVERSKAVPFQRVLFGLGIRFVGETTAKYLAEHFRSLDAVMRATREELTQADEVGGRMADAIIEYFAVEQNHAIIRRLRAAGLKFEEEARELAAESLAGRSFVVSGKFSRSRDEMKELIEMHGGRNLAAVSANVDYIVAGDNIGAGVGEMVLVTTDETTQHGLDHPSPIDAFIVGIVDNPPTLSK